MSNSADPFVSVIVPVWQDHDALAELLTKYLAGIDPALLARQYYGRKPAAVVMMARAPWTGGKTRLHTFDEATHADLRRALFEDTLDAHRIDWSTGHVLRQTLERATELRLPILRLEEWSDVDDLGDLEGFARGGVSAPRTREWVRRDLRAASTQRGVTRQRR